MRCPIMSKAVEKKGFESFVFLADCLKEECAWWHPATQSCEVSRIAGNLSGINNALISILDKLPYKREI